MGFGTAKSDWNTVLSMITEKKLNLEGLITQRYKLHQLKEGLQDMVNLTRGDFPIIYRCLLIFGTRQKTFKHADTKTLRAKSKDKRQ